MPALSKHQCFQTDKAGHCWPDPVMDSLYWPVSTFVGATEVMSMSEAGSGTAR